MTTIEDVIEEAEEVYSEEEEALFSGIFEDTATMERLGFSLAIEEPPVKTRKQREPSLRKTPWEDYLLVLKTQPGWYVRWFAFVDGEDEPEGTAKKAAQQRARSMRNRMEKIYPGDIFEIDAVEDKEDGSWKVFAEYEREATEDELEERVAKMEARQERALRSRSS